MRSAELLQPASVVAVQHLLADAGAVCAGTPGVVLVMRHQFMPEEELTAWNTGGEGGGGIVTFKLEHYRRVVHTADSILRVSLKSLFFFWNILNSVTGYLGECCFHCRAQKETLPDFPSAR